MKDELIGKITRKVEEELSLYISRYLPVYQNPFVYCFVADAFLTCILGCCRASFEGMDTNYKLHVYITYKKSFDQILAGIEKLL